MKYMRHKNKMSVKIGLMLSGGGARFLSGHSCFESGLIRYKISLE